MRSATAVLPLWSIYLPSRRVLTCLWSIVDIWDRESLLQNPKSLQVALEDLHSFDDALSERLRRMPAEYLPLVIPLALIFHFTLRLLFLWRSKNGLPPFEDMLLTLHLACQWRRTNSAAMSTVFSWIRAFACVQFEVAAAEVLVGLKSKVAGEGGEMEEPSTGDVQVLLTSKESPVSIRNLAVSGPSLPQVCERIEAHDLTCCIALSCVAVHKILPSFWVPIHAFILFGSTFSLSAVYLQSCSLCSCA